MILGSPNKMEPAQNMVSISGAPNWPWHWHIVSQMMIWQAAEKKPPRLVSHIIHRFIDTITVLYNVIFGIGRSNIRGPLLLSHSHLSLEIHYGTHLLRSQLICSWFSPQVKELCTSWYGDYMRWYDPILDSILRYLNWFARIFSIRI